MTKKLVNQKLPSLKPMSNGGWNLIPDNMMQEQNYRIERIKLPHIRVPEKTREQIVQALDEGKTYVQLGQITLMLNTIAAIEPYPVKR